MSDDNLDVFDAQDVLQSEDIPIQDDLIEEKLNEPKLLSEDDVKKGYVPKEIVTEKIKHYRKKSYAQGYEKAKQELLKMTEQNEYKTYSQDDIDSIVSQKVEENIAKFAEMAKQEESKKYYENMASKFVDKIQSSTDERVKSALEKIDDFSSIANLVPDLLDLPNTEHVLADLVENPHKLVTLNGLYGLGSKKIAQSELKKISDVLVQNEVAKKSYVKTNHNNSYSDKGNNIDSMSMAELSAYLLKNK
jgi:hypothetical protein